MVVKLYCELRSKLTYYYVKKPHELNYYLPGKNNNIFLLHIQVLVMHKYDEMFSKNTYLYIVCPTVCNVPPPRVNNSISNQLF